MLILFICWIKETFEALNLIRNDSSSNNSLKSSQEYYNN